MYEGFSSTSPYSINSSVRLSTLFMFLFIICDVLIRSRLYQFISDGFRTGMLAAIAGMILFSAVLSFFRRLFFPLILFTLFFAIFVWELVHFSQLFDTDLNLNSLGQLYGPLSFIFFVQFGNKELIRKFAFATLVVASFYLVIYCSLALANLVGLLPRVVLERMAVNDSERGVRIFLASDTTATVFFLCATGYVKGRMGRILFWLSLLAITLSLSRFYTFLVIVCYATYRAGFARYLAFICLIIFVGESSLLIFGVFEPSFNPFDAVRSDSSGWVRSIEYDLARASVWRDPISGLGFPTSDSALAQAVSSNFFSTSDIGAINVWSVFGLFGLLIYFFSAIPLARAFERYDDSLKLSFYLTGCLVLGENAIAPLSLINPGSLIFGCALAAWLKNQNRQLMGPKIGFVPGAERPSWSHEWFKSVQS